MCFDYYANVNINELGSSKYTRSVHSKQTEYSALCNEILPH